MGMAKAFVAQSMKRGLTIWNLLKKRVYSTLLLNPRTLGPRVTEANGHTRSGHIRNVFEDDFKSSIMLTLESYCTEHVCLERGEHLFRFGNFSSLTSCFSTDIVARVGQGNYSAALPLYRYERNNDEKEMGILGKNTINALVFNSRDMTTVMALDERIVDGILFLLCVIPKPPPPAPNDRTHLRFANTLGNDVFLWGKNGWIARDALVPFAIPIVTYRLRVRGDTSLGSLIFTCIPTVISHSGQVVY